MLNVCFAFVKFGCWPSSCDKRGIYLLCGIGWRWVDYTGSQASNAAQRWVCGEGLCLQRHLSSALFLSPSLQCPKEKGRYWARLEACLGQCCGRTARDMPVTTGLHPNLGTHVVCHCSPCLTLPSPGGQRMGTEGSAVATLPMLGWGHGS